MYAAGGSPRRRVSKVRSLYARTRRKNAHYRFTDIDKHAHTSPLEPRGERLRRSRRRRRRRESSARRPCACRRVDHRPCRAGSRASTTCSPEGGRTNDRSAAANHRLAPADGHRAEAARGVRSAAHEVGGGRARVGRRPPDPRRRAVGAADPTGNDALWPARRVAPSGGSGVKTTLVEYP